MSTSGTVSTTVEVSWDGSGAFTGAYDDVTSDVVAESGVVIDEGRDGARTLSPPKVPATDFDLWNDDRRYSQENAASPIYQRVEPSRPVRVMVQHGDLADRRLYRSNTLYRANVAYRGRPVYQVAATAIDQIAQSAIIGDQRVEMETLGSVSTLIGKQVSVSLQQDIRTDQAISLLLDAAGWPAALREISIGDSTLLWWWCDERSPWAAMMELLACEGPGALYQDRAGVIHFENRNYRAIAARSTTSQATFRDVAVVGGHWFTHLAYEPGFRDIYNRATISTKRRAVDGSATKVWEYGATLTLTANQTRTLIARTNDPFTGGIPPASGTDYTVSAGSASVSLTNSQGFLAYIVVTAGASGATIVGVTSSGIQLRAYAMPVVSETIIQNSIDASASIARYGARTLEVRGWPEIEPAQAEAVCNAWVTKYRDVRPTLKLTLRNPDGNHVRQIMSRRTSDRITVIDGHTGMSGDVWVESRQLRVAGAGGRTVECVLGCEMVSALSGGIWNVSLWDNAAAVWGI